MSSQESDPVSGNQIDESKSEWQDILDNGKILKKVLVAGDESSPRPETGSKITINIEVKLKDTGEIVKSETRSNFEIFCGEFDVLHGVDLVVPLMHEKEKCQVIVAPRFGFGERGKSPEIPPNATLDCTVELIKIEFIDGLDSLSVDKRRSTAESKKERGNFFYNRGEYSSCILCYKKALEHLDSIQLDEQLDDDLASYIAEFKSTIFNNLAAAQMKQSSYNAALESLNKVLSFNENNVKALYRKAKVLNLKGEVVEAIYILNKLLKIDPSVNVAKKELVELIERRKKETLAEMDMCKKMLDTGNNSPEENPRNNETSNAGSFTKSLATRMIHSLKKPVGYLSVAVALAGILALNIYTK